MWLILVSALAFSGGRILVEGEAGCPTSVALREALSARSDLRGAAAKALSVRLTERPDGTRVELLSGIDERVLVASRTFTAQDRSCPELAAGIAAAVSSWVRLSTWDAPAARGAPAAAASPPPREALAAWMIGAGAVAGGGGTGGDGATTPVAGLLVDGSIGRADHAWRFRGELGVTGWEASQLAGRGVVWLRPSLLVGAERLISPKWSRKVLISLRGAVGAATTVARGDGFANRWVAGGFLPVGSAGVRVQSQSGGLTPWLQIWAQGGWSAPTLLARPERDRLLLPALTLGLGVGLSYGGRAGS